jgi:peptidoglycan/xylan/chitin deacetylase (PgdA/CDA1 family)
MKNIRRIVKVLSTFVIMLALLGTAGATPKVIFTFDDGDTGVYFKAFPIMEANNQSGVAFLITNQVIKASGNNGWADINITEARDLYSKGWDISSHTANHYDLTTRNNTQLNMELNTSRNWLESSGFTRSYRFLAYPYGAYNSNVIAAVKNSGYLAARTVEDDAGIYKAYKLTDPDIYTMKTLMVYSFPAYGQAGEPPEVVKRKINDTIAQNGLLMLSFHMISDICCVAGVNAPEEYKTSDFKIISDFLKEKQDAGQLKVVTMSEYFGTDIPTPTPTPTPTPPPIDTTPPNITIVTPIATTYNEGTTILANYSCTDETSMKSCIGTVPNGTKINVTGAGNKTFTVFAEDTSGNNNSKTVNYTVLAQSPIQTPITVNISVSADSYVSSKAPTKNYGTATFIYVDAGRIGYFKYNFSVIPQKANISSAELHDFISWSQANGTAKMFAVTGTWTETGIKWSLRPTNESVSYGIYDIPICNTGNGDCTHMTKGFGNIVQRWVNGSLANNGFMITTAATITNSEIDAKESGHIPYISVTYT